MTLMILSRSLGQRSRLVNDDHRNLVTSIDAEPVQGFKPKLAQIFRTPQPRSVVED